MVIPYVRFRKDKMEIAEHQKQRQLIEQDRTLTPELRRKKINRLNVNPKWITDLSYWWSQDHLKIRDAKSILDIDLAVARLEPFEPKWVPEYPVFKDPTSGMNPGTSLCKLGYPFHKIGASFNEANGNFTLAKGSVPLPRFPIEGIYTRNVVLGQTNDRKYYKKFLETSTPGLRGQSGGAIFDANGTIWALQSRTSHFALGFNPKITRKNKEIEEHQFLNTGLGVHCEVITAFLKDNSIKFTMSDY